MFLVDFLTYSIYNILYYKIKKEYARKRWAKENNPNYISVDKDILLDKILNGEKLDAITAYFNCSRVTIFNKCEEYFGTTKTREVRKQYAK